ncbi:MAG: radical SAM protein [Candidatus Thiodiazotropha taylori]
MRLSNYIERIDIGNDSFLISLLTNSIVKAQEKITNETLQELGSERLTMLVDNGLVTELNEEEEANFADDLFNHMWNNANVPPSVTIAPSLSCNLACPYCYEVEQGVDTQSDIISEYNMQKILAFLSKKKITDIALYGGEPLLHRNKSVLVPLFDYIMNNNGTINVTTNGTQLDAFREYINKKCISIVQITMDGMKCKHDQYRVTKGGKGTYDDILSNVDMVVKSGAKLTIRMNVNADNYSSCKELEKYLLKRYSEFDNFAVYFAPIRGDMCDFSYGEKEFIHPVTYNLRSSIAISKTMPPPKTFFCSTTSKSGSLVFAPCGVWNCWHFVGQEDKKLFGYDELERSQSYHTVLPQFSDQCIQCKYRFLCAGDCIVDWDNGCDMEKKSEIFSNSIASIINERQV